MKIWGGLTSTLVVVDPTNPNTVYYSDAFNLVKSADGGRGSVSVTAPARCRWSASADAGWITLAAADGEGSRELEFTVARNPLARPFAATISVGGQKLTVLQGASPPTSRETAEFFVRQHYRDFLNREPDPAGLDFWANQITACGRNLACTDAKRVEVSAAFFISIEFQNTGYLVHRLYKSAYGRMPLHAEFVPDTKQIGRGVMVGVGDWSRLLEENQQAFAAEFVARPEFVARYGGRTNAEYVDDLFANAGVTPGPSERAALVNGLGGGSETRATVLRKVAENERLYQQDYNPAFVLMQYFGYLRRDPDALGFDFWLTKLNDFSRPAEDVRNDSVALGRVRRAEMVKAFIVSIEYGDRFR